MTDTWRIGIDLGTTHTVVAFATNVDRRPTIFPVPQLVTASDIDARALLPSFLYAPASGESTPDPWGDAPWVVGAHARRRGQEVSGRLVSSAKSWLSYAAVDRRAAILPWGVDPDTPVPRLSPVEASERLLRHIEKSWNAAFPAQPLSAQSLVLTVPASFDEVARELTVEAAERAGLSVRLLEEPQAAFYDFMAQTGVEPLERLVAERGRDALVLVCDVGGGTTDLTLIRAGRAANGSIELERLAVGRHLLLGGDNIDLALAHLCEPRLVTPPARLSPTRFTELVLACRAAKERLLAEGAPDSLPIDVADRGSALVGTTASTRIAREEVENVVLNGFLPEVARDARAQRSRAGLVAFGLPYEQDAAITRHLATFFARHAQQPAPDALLLNGGLFRAHRAAERLRSVVESWGTEPVLLLPHPEPDLAVARGAVEYALTLEGNGTRIAGGTPQGFYVGVEAHGERRALSVLPRGSREGERHVARVRGLTLRVGAPVRFDLFAFDSTETQPPGTLVPIDEERFVRLPPVTASFDSAVEGRGGELPVAIEGELTAVGTVELHCVEIDAPAERAPRRFRLAFDLRAEPGPKASERPPEPSTRAKAPAGGQRLGQAEEAIDRVFGRGRSDVKPRETKDLFRELERLLGERRTWSLETNRAVFDAVCERRESRRRSEDHERVFWMLAGYCLRPGFGHARDPSRVGKIRPLFEQGLAFAQHARVYQQYWIAWRRVAAGLEEPAQTRIRDAIDPFVAPSEAKLKKPKNLRPLAPEEMLELASWLERVRVERRVELGRWLLERTWTSRDPRLWAALGRIGARVPAYASVHHVVPALVVERWLDHLLRERWAEMPSAARAAFELTRVTEDRARDVSEPVRREVAKRLETSEAPAEWVRAVREFVPVLEADRAATFGEELPVGLRLSE